MINKFDFLVIGSGIAGMSFALKVAGKGNVALICKTTLEEANTYFAQGGIASVTNPLVDNFEKHIEDTMIAGDWLSERAAVEKVVREAPAQISELISWGVDFDKNEKGEFDLHKEGGHSEFRILHHKDSTGAEIQDSLIRAVKKHPNIEIFENHFAVEILTQHHLGRIVTRQTPDIQCYGAYILNLKTGKTDTFLSKFTLMATGGVGAVYQTTTNPLVATGDGVAMVYRAKGTVKDMEFVQFHPTAFYHPGDRPSFLITEAMRGYGAVLRTMDGQEFMQKYDPRLSLAPRDIVARAIDNEMKNRGDDHVYLDVTHKDPEETKSHFPNIYEKCLSLGVDITKDYIPVAPAAHYLCGGILVDMDAQSSIERLYAVGECSCTGLHGGNRLASNSLIEAVVYADAAARHSLSRINAYEYNDRIPEWNDTGTRSPEEMVLITQSMKEVNQIMSAYVGIVRSDLRLQRAWTRLDLIYEETESLFKRSFVSRDICELRNVINVGYLIMRQAIERKESRGLHYTIDYPEKVNQVKANQPRNTIKNIMTAPYRTTNRKKRRFYRRKSFYLLLGLVLGVSVSAALYQVSVYYSTDESCMICHVHPHVEESWRLSGHMNNRSGTRVHCVDCHLPPKTDTWAHYTAKVKLGMKDVWGYLTKDSADFDWDARSELEHAIRYIPNESCKECHHTLFPEGVTDDAITAHLYYEENEEKLDLQCISCHLDAGHYNPNYQHSHMTGVPGASTAAADSSLFFKEPTQVTSFETFTEQLPGTAVSFRMVAIPGGTFTMGSPEKEPFRKPDEGPARQVTLSSFFMAETQVTWDMYWAFYRETMSEGRTPPEVAFANNSNPDVDVVTGPTPPFGFPDQGWGSGDRPAITMTHYAAETFCQWLSMKTGKSYRLPTEAEWEYAARGGTETPYFFEGSPRKYSDQGFWRNFFSADTEVISSFVVYQKNSRNRTQLPSEVQPNPYGLKSMLGNVLEYCADKYDPEAYSKSDVNITNPLVTTGTEWVVRGGNYSSDAADLRSAARSHTEHDAWLRTDPQQPKSIWWYSDIKGIGFRIVCDTME